MKWSFILSRKFSREEAKTILKYMQEIIDKYGYVTLGDFYDLSGFGVTTLDEYDDTKGWRSLKGASVSLTKFAHDGYIIELPALEKIPQ